jgi:hypothetical protein
MNVSSWPAIFGQLLSLAPVLIVLIGGMVVVGVWWRRAPRAAMLAMAGLGVMLLVSAVGPVVQWYLVMNRPAGGPVAGFARTMAILGIVLSLVRALGLGLLIAAVFAERPRVLGGFDVRPAFPTPPPPMAGLAQPSRDA